MLDPFDGVRKILMEFPTFLLLMYKNTMLTKYTISLLVQRWERVLHKRCCKHLSKGAFKFGRIHFSSKHSENE